MTRQITVFSTIVVAVAACLIWLAWARAHPAPFSEQVDLKAMGSFDLADDPRTTDAAIPKLLLALDGRRVALDGFIYAPQSSDEAVTTFQLVYDTPRSSSHGMPPRAQERVYATVTGGRSVPNPGMYTLVRVHGVLHVGIQRDDVGKIASVYRMDVEQVDDVK